MQQQGMPAGVAKTATAGAVVLPDLLAPADVAEALGVPEADVMAIIQSGELAAKKIGTSYRIRRASLDEYLSK
jgi:excisionase family DNA binding protein